MLLILLFANKLECHNTVGIPIEVTTLYLTKTSLSILPPQKAETSSTSPGNLLQSNFPE